MSCIFYFHYLISNDMFDNKMRQYGINEKEVILLMQNELRNTTCLTSELIMKYENVVEYIYMIKNFENLEI